MITIKKTISIPDELCKKASEISNNFSEAVVIALKEYLLHLKIKKAHESFGQWENREEESIVIVNQLRTEGDRIYVNRSH